jgi:DNA-binding response OmpR family regulator
LLASGAVAYLTKPLEIAQVLRLVDDRLKRTAEPIPENGG